MISKYRATVAYHDKPLFYLSVRGLEGFVSCTLFWIPGWKWCYPKRFSHPWPKCKWANPATQAHSEPLLTSRPLKLIGKGKSHGQAQGGEEGQPSHHRATNTGEWRIRPDNRPTEYQRPYSNEVDLLLQPKLFQSCWGWAGMPFSLM